ncbi:hypothetical protein [Dongia sp.]|uniref:hypothetical protein n=1 Tax=Dongia sp. TaxID=1977262 RepID=UPI0035B41589
MNGGSEDDTKRAKPLNERGAAPSRRPSHIDKKARSGSSPAFDVWLERQLKLMFAAQETPPDMRLLELIREAFPDAPDKITK